MAGGSATAAGATQKRKAAAVPGSAVKRPATAPPGTAAKMSAGAAGSHETNLVIGEDPVKAMAKLDHLAKTIRAMRRKVGRREDRIRKLEAAGRADKSKVAARAQGVPGVPQDPLAPRRGPPGFSPYRESAIGLVENARARTSARTFGLAARPAAAH